MIRLCLTPDAPEGGSPATPPATPPQEKNSPPPAAAAVVGGERTESEVRLAAEVEKERKRNAALASKLAEVEAERSKPAAKGKSSWTHFED